MNDTSDDDHKTRKYKPSFAEGIVIFNALTERMQRTSHPDPQDPGRMLYKYEDGWSDQRLARQISPKLNKGHVARIRQQMFGRLMRGEDQPPAPAATDLEARVTRLEKILTKLCEGLGMPCDE